MDYPHPNDKWKNLCIQHWNCWSFIHKLHFIGIGSCHFGYCWITVFLYKLTMKIWNLWQFWNDIFLLVDNWIGGCCLIPSKESYFAFNLSSKLCPLQLSFFLFFFIRVLIVFDSLVLCIAFFSDIAGPLRAVFLIWVLTIGSLKPW